MDTVESVTLLHNHAIWRNVALPIGSPPPLWKASYSCRIGLAATSFPLSASFPSTCGQNRSRDPASSTRWSLKLEPMDKADSTTPAGSDRLERL